MPQVSVEVTGLREMVRDLERAGVEINDLKDVFGRVATEAADVGQGFTPRGQTGNLAGSVRGNRAKNKAIVTWGKARVRYAGPILYGWPKRNIRPARTTERTDAVMDERAPVLLEQGLAHIIERYGFA